MAKEWTDGFYTSLKWRRVRNAYYKKQKGICERCQSEIKAGKRNPMDAEPGVIVHHKIELTPDNINIQSISLGFDNLELLCATHHNKEHKAKGKRYKFNDDGSLSEY